MDAPQYRRGWYGVGKDAETAVQQVLSSCVIAVRSANSAKANPKSGPLAGGRWRLPSESAGHADKWNDRFGFDAGGAARGHGRSRGGVGGLYL